MNLKSQDTTCPNCGHSYNISDVLFEQIQTQVVKQNQAQIEQKLKMLEQKEKEALESNRAKEAELKRKETELNKLAESNQEIIDRAVSEKLLEKENILKNKLTNQIREELTTQKDSEIENLKNVINRNSNELKEYYQLKSANEELKRQFEFQELKIKAEAEERLSKQLKEEKEKYKREISANTENLLKEKDIRLNQLQEQISELKKKSEQGSMQLQGEAQELIIEDYLRNEFKYDEISEVKKGQKGADCIHFVKNNFNDIVGNICYESKRTKSFNSDWIRKLKEDAMVNKSNYCVIVTETMPLNMDRLSLVEGVWICSFDEFKGLCKVLRQAVVSISEVATAQVNKSDKMSMLYDFLTGNEFKSYVEMMVETYTSMKSDLEKEKNWQNRNFKKREAELEKLLTGTTGFYGTLQGIAGKSIPNISALDSPFEIKLIE